MAERAISRARPDELVCVDSSLEGDGFELSVPRQIGDGFEVSSRRAKRPWGAVVSSEHLLSAEESVCRAEIR